MPFSVTDSVDRYVADLEEERLPDGKWHPSSIASACERQSIYTMRGTEKSNPISTRTKRVFRVGHLMHEFVQAAIESDEDVTSFWPEVSIESEALNITGHADGLLMYADGSFEVLEFKTIKSTAFRYGDLPKPDHIVQVSLYMKVLREHGAVLRDGSQTPPLGDRLKRGRIVYVSKDDLQISEHTILWTAAKDKDIMDRLARLNGHQADGTLPDRLPMKGAKRHYLCGYCSYEVTCWATSPKENA